MSLLHRWSLPSRGFTRDKSEDEAPTDQSKSLTFHIGQLGPRRRANLSSVFSTLFEKPENRRSIRDADDRSEVADDLPLLASRRENVRPDTEFRYSYDHEGQDLTTPVEAIPLRQGGMFEPISKNTTTSSTEPPPYLTPDVFGQVARQMGQSKRLVLSASQVQKFMRWRAEMSIPPKSLQRTIDNCKRNCSTSSSYPSEGMRSPVSGYCSPEPAITHTITSFAEYRRFGRYPSQSSWHLSSMDINEASASDDAGGKTSAALAIGNVTPNYAMGGQSYNLETSPFANLPEDGTHPAGSYIAQSRRRSSIIHRAEPHQKPSSNSELTVPILENEDTISSQLEVSFMSYKRPNTPNTSSTSDDDNDYQLERRNASSVDRLHPSVDTDRTMLTAIRRTSASDRDGAWSTIHEVRERPLSRPASWIQLLALNSSNDSSNTLSSAYRS